MPNTALVFGALLFALGPIFYFLGETGHQSPTSFIPSLFGILIAAFGFAARAPSRTKAAMHGAAGFALLGTIGAFMQGFARWPLLLTGRITQLTQTQIMSGWATLLMFVLCLLFLVKCVQWFLSNRRARRADG